MSIANAGATNCVAAKIVLINWKRTKTKNVPPKMYRTGNVQGNGQSKIATYI